MVKKKPDATFLTPVAIPKSLHKALSERAMAEGVSLDDWCVAAVAEAVGRATAMANRVETETLAKYRFEVFDVNGQDAVVVHIPHTWIPLRGDGRKRWLLKMEKRVLRLFPKGTKVLLLPIEEKP